jgi:predicted transcriptional regulator
MKNRSEIEIMAAILRCATANWEYKTTIMNNASVSHSQLIRYLGIAEDRGLIEYSKITGLYRTTEAGLIFLDKHDEILLLLPSITDLPDVIHHSEENSVVSETITE